MYDQSWRNAPNRESWRPYQNYAHEGAMRPQFSGAHHHHQQGYTMGMSNPYMNRNMFSRQHAYNVEMNRMHNFNNAPFVHHAQRPPSREPIAEPYLMEMFEQQSHVPGLQVGRQQRELARERMKNRNEKKGPVDGVEELKVDVEVSSEKIGLRWSHLDSRNVRYVVYFSMTKSAGRPTKDGKRVERSSTQNYYDIRAVAGQTYRIVVECFSLTSNKVIGSSEIEVKAEFSYSELKTLHDKCMQFITTGNNEHQRHEFWYMYRCKPKVYWDEIHHCCNDVMKKYIKDDNGQPANLINGKINGLFFSARLLRDNTLPPSSPFGNVRMVVDAWNLLNPHFHNFYFADFYCNAVTHYVTVVICKKNSETDRFCRPRLMPLNPEKNPFVQVIRTPMINMPPRFFVNCSVWVELYYTEDVELNMGTFDAIMTTGAGTSRIGGLPNNKKCTICNLYPQVEGQQRADDDDISTDATVDVSDAEKEDSTLSALLKEDRNADSDVIYTLRNLVEEVVFDCCASASDFMAKSDSKVAEAVELMNKQIAAKKPSTSNGPGSSGSILEKIAKNLNDFINQFIEDRNLAMETIEEMKSTSC